MRFLLDFEYNLYVVWLFWLTLESMILLLLAAGNLDSERRDCFNLPYSSPGFCHVRLNQQNDRHHHVPSGCEIYL
jgi:hypothetical protein